MTLARLERPRTDRLRAALRREIEALRIAWSVRALGPVKAETRRV